MYFVQFIGIVSIAVVLVHAAPGVDKRDLDLGVGADIELDIGANINIGLGDKDHDEHYYKRDLNLGVGADINLGVGADINVGLEKDHDEHRRPASTNNRVNNEKDASVVVLVNSNNQS